MIVTTTENIAGHRTVQTLGQCFGVVVRSRGLGGNLMAGLGTIVGGEITNTPSSSRRRAATLSIGWCRTQPRWERTPS